MGDDIRRYLSGEPLQAGPESAAYRIKKQFRKHKAAVVSIVAIFLVLIVALIAISMFAVEIENQRKYAEQSNANATEQAKLAEQAKAEAERERDQIKYIMETTNVLSVELERLMTGD